MQRPLPCFPLHTNAYAGTHIMRSFEFNPQTHSQPHIYTCFHTLPLCHAEARTLSRLIISQVCHFIFIWASEMLTSISLSTLAFSPFCHLSVSHCFSLRSHHFLLFLSLSLFLFVFLPPWPGIAEGRLLQVVFGVRSDEKLRETRG